MNWIKDLEALLEGEVSFDSKIILEHSQDASIFQVMPNLVVFPKNFRDLQKLMRFVNRFNRRASSWKKAQKYPLKLTLTARAAGTCMSGGPLTQSIVVSFTKYMNKLVSLNPKVAVVEPGLYYHEMEKAMNRKKLYFPSFPASKSICALGGMIANNAGSEKNMLHGQTVEHVKSLNVLLSDGNVYDFGPLTKKQLNMKLRKDNFEGKVYRKMYQLLEENYDLIKNAAPKTSKNSCGYLLWKVWDRDTGVFDLSKIFVGSQGTLGLWSQAKVAVVRRKNHSRLIAVYLKDLKDMADLVKMLLPYAPNSLESFDRNTMLLGLRFMPQIARKTGKGLLKRLFSFWREALLMLRHGLPVFIVLVEISENRLVELKKRIVQVDAVLKNSKIPHLVMQSSQESEKYWTIRRESFSLLREHVKGKQTVPFVDDFAVLPSELPVFLPKLYNLLKSHGIKPTLAGHAGDGNFHVIPLMDLKDKKERDKIPVVLKDFVDLVLAHGGTITAEHNDGLIRTSFVEKQYGPKMTRLFEKVKDIFDPQNVFNPGKKVYGDFKFAMKHVKTK